MKFMTYTQILHYFKLYKLLCSSRSLLIKSAFTLDCSLQKQAAQTSNCQTDLRGVRHSPCYHVAKGAFSDVYI